MPNIQNRDYIAFFNWLPEAAWIIDAETTFIVDANEAAVTIYGYKKEEFLDLKVSDIDALEDEVAAKARTKELIEKQHASFKTQHRTKSGTVIDVEVSVSLMDIEGKRYFTVICQDITGVNEQQRQFEAIFENIEEGLLIEELETGRYIACNAYACQMFGYSKTEIVGLSVKELIPREEYTSFDSVRPKLASGQITILKEKALLRKDGSSFYADIDLSRIYTIGGKQYLAAMIRDVTESRRIREELLYSRKKFMALFNQMPEAAWVVDGITTRFLDSNLANEKQYGYSKEEFLRLHISDIDIYDSPEVVEARNEQVKQDGQAVFETRHRTKGGDILDVIVSIQMFLVEGRPMMIVTCHDITDVKSREKTLNDLNLQLEKRVVQELEKRMDQQKLLLQQSKLAAKGELIQNIAHQWRQPLNAVAGMIQNLQLYAEMQQLSPQEIQEVVSKAMDHIVHLSKIIDKFSNFFSSPEEKFPFDVRQQVRETLELFESRLKEQHITVKTTGSPMRVEGFVNDFKQVLFALVNNAVDAIVKRRGKEPSFDAAIEITIGQKGSVKEIIVKDNGIGIAPEIEEKVFDPYFTTKFQAQDVGISLYMSKMIIERSFGGHLLFDNKKSGETRFVIELP